MARKRFAGTSAQHRADAASFAKEARGFAQKARAAARNGKCGRAVFFFGAAALAAGRSQGNRKWIKRRGGSLYQGGSHFGHHLLNLRKMIVRTCQIPGDDY